MNQRDLEIHILKNIDFLFAGVLFHFVLDIKVFNRKICPRLVRQYFSRIVKIGKAFEDVFQKHHIVEYRYNRQLCLFIR